MDVDDNNKGGVTFSFITDNNTRHIGNTNSNSITTTAKVFVANLDFSVTWQELKQHFQQIGDVVRADILKNERTGLSKVF